MPAVTAPLPQPLTFERAAAALRSLGERHADIERLEVFGSVARGEASADSDLDVLLVFREPLKLRGFYRIGRLDELAEEIQAALGVPVDLHERASAEQCRNPLRRASVLDGARLAYAA